MGANHKRLWEQLREQTIKADGQACVRCGKPGSNDLVLQVHHKAYVSGRAYWDYPLDMLETLCKGCHAREHNIVSPDSGWTLARENDLGGKVGTCDYCGTTLRYVFQIEHPDWPALEVGQDCCDLLTQSNEASQRMKEFRLRNDRRNRFISGEGWITDDNGALANRLNWYRVQIVKHNEGWRVFLNGKRARSVHVSTENAKGAVFDFIESGKAREWFKARR